MPVPAMPPPLEGIIENTKSSTIFVRLSEVSRSKRHQRKMCRSLPCKTLFSRHLLRITSVAFYGHGATFLITLGDGDLRVTVTSERRQRRPLHDTGDKPS
ncbi:hypothetical protein CDAR_525021 [Caerostris darwini]|uniref:Uncharacterized protein n=1 Tax=Caerostris darwini TaxID=1538125 RepID=A0AAV4QYL9_9ARAC|nr:hypothetical protein CDAR_525021 [Caerostris darwini]